MRSIIFPLPWELSLQILSHLSLEDLKSLSVCSKEVRRFTSVVLFSGVKLCPRSVCYFEGGGGLEGVIEGVRSVRIAYPQSTLPSEYINLFRTVTRLLSKFSGLKTLRIELFTCLKENRRILNAVFKILAGYSWYDGLRKLVILWMDYMSSEDGFTPQDLDFLYSGSRVGASGGKKERWGWPKGLEEVYVANQVMEGWRFRKDMGGAFYGTFGEGIIADLGACGMGKLKRVEIIAFGIVTNRNWRGLRGRYMRAGDDINFNNETLPGGNDGDMMRGMVRFPTVTRLKIDVMKFEKKNLAEIVMRFPGLEELSVLILLERLGDGSGAMVAKYFRNKVVWKDILGLKKLKRVTLPWPSWVREGDSSRTCEVEKEHLKDSVAWWVRRWMKMGVDPPEKVRFLQWKFEVGEEFLDFKITKDGNIDGNGNVYWRVENGKRKHPQGLDRLDSLWSLKEVIEKESVDVDVGDGGVEEGIMGGNLGNLDENEEEEREDDDGDGDDDDGGYGSEFEEGEMHFEQWDE
ncbi:hypothetical protein TWF225_006843 [Orbilia oligospora]|uniref:F-box domain-containing protein n=1 Tax=Orbilia oligospora TaxID=2813651 RepID=A0A7C8U3L9_ORBOL|nr:hypothetical protein TWF751_008420 [Orbilia oligospora]KAF3194291.1 hypothetical protein TWF225_006843 [Orbilia oligospora]KAF3235632.1 hypothetical protein TWF217_003102 [Orbilia oligospora]KAF3240784.1 hypothetical protein TWF128_011206 [Orbilia oligospora]TGJ68466.1 hypothetical protein EYR41_007515 [Orbilia oligospora]